MTYWVYILSNASNRVLYIGMTNDIARRMQEHRDGSGEGFAKRYNLRKLVYAESTPYVQNAIAREKQLKGWLRARKITLVESINPTWQDLIEEWSILCHPEQCEGSQ